MMVSIGRVAGAVVLARCVALGPVVTIARARAVTLRSGSICDSTAAPASPITSGSGVPVGAAVRAGLMRARCVAAVARKVLAAALSKKSGIPMIQFTGTG